MFWGLIMEPKKRYTQIVEKPFHLSMASLDASTTNGGYVQVMICYDERHYLLCTLQKDKILQVPLDFNFEEGTKISFTCNGDGNVHLTGFLIPEDEEGLEDFEDDSDEEDEEAEEEIPKLVETNKKRKSENRKDKPDVKRNKLSLEVEAEEDDDSEDDSDFDMEDSDLSGDENDLEDSDNEDEDDDDDEDEEEDEEEEEEEEKPVVETKLSKKEKQKQNKQKPEQKQNNQTNQNQSQKEKKDKNKMMNGKQETEKEKPKQKKGKNDSKNDSKSSDDGKVEQQQKKRTVEGGVVVTDLKMGNGAPAKPGKFVSVYYVGRLKNGKKFDSTQQGNGFKFRLGKGEVIKGWDVGVAGMKVGGKRLLGIPPNMAYGAKGSPPVIPPNSFLNFEVELKSVH